MAITDFSHKGLKQLFLDGKSSKVAPDLQKNARLILTAIDAMRDLKDLSGVKNFHPLRGRRGYYSMHVNGNYCITFTLDESCNAVHVDLEDYH